VVTTFIVLNALGRSLNIVMSAGLAFAVGNVVDNSIVVLENIFRHREMGNPVFKAALDWRERGLERDSGVDADQPGGVSPDYPDEG
jgi:Cu/Ag efflux pump CusA